MDIFLLIIHVLVSFMMILMVLVQKGKGADIGAAFGGATQTVFGPRGAQSFLAKLTTGAAVIFMFTSLGLALLASQKASIMEGVKQEQTQQAPIPLPPPAAAPAQQ